MFKNVASQKIPVFAWDTANRIPKTGDAANITGKISKDGGAAASTDDTNPTELDATNFPGIYIFDLTQAETNAEFVILQAKSSTTDIQILPVMVYTTHPLTAINAEVVDALATDTYAEPGQGAPAATATLSAKINYLYKAWRNKKTQDATTFELYNDAGAVIDQKATVSDDGTDYTFGEIVSGA